MKLLFDQNLSHRIVRAVQDTFPDSAHVRDFNCASAEDADIWLLARDRGYAIVSKDDDFHQRAILLGQPPKVIWLRLGNCSTTRVIDVMLRATEEIRLFCADPEQSLMVIAHSSTLYR